MTEKLTKEQKQNLAGLLSNEENSVLKSISSIRTHGGKYSIKPLMEIYFSSPHKSVEEAIYQLFCDTKDNSISELIMEVISNYTTKPRFPQFISALWQSYVSFNTLLPFVSIYDTADDLLAVEIFTLIENNVENLSREEKSNCKAFLKANINKYGEFKKNMASQMIEFM